MQHVWQLSNQEGVLICDNCKLMWFKRKHCVPYYMNSNGVYFNYINKNCAEVIMSEVLK